MVTQMWVLDASLVFLSTPPLLLLTSIQSKYALQQTNISTVLLNGVNNYSLISMVSIPG